MASWNAPRTHNHSLEKLMRAWLDEAACARSDTHMPARGEYTARESVTAGGQILGDKGRKMNLRPPTKPCQASLLGDNKKHAGPTLGHEARNPLGSAKSGLRWTLKRGLRKAASESDSDSLLGPTAGPAGPLVPESSWMWLDDVNLAEEFATPMPTLRSILRFLTIGARHVHASRHAATPAADRGISLCGTSTNSRGRLWGIISRGRPCGVVSTSRPCTKDTACLDAAVPGHAFVLSIANATCGGYTRATAPGEQVRARKRKAARNKCSTHPCRRLAG